MTQKISIVLPCYNAAEFIGDNLKSIFSQNFSNFEVIAINDGSTDETGNILDAAAKQYKNLRVYYQENKGESAAFFAGVKCSNGKYIVRQDADDLMMPGRLRAQYQWMEINSTIDVAGSWMWTFSKDRSLKHRILTSTHAGSLPLLFCFTSQIANPTSIYRSHVLKNISIPSYKIGSDLAIFLQLILNGAILSNMPLETVQYRLHKSQATSRDKLKDIETSVSQIYMDYKQLLCKNERVKDFYEYGFLWRSNALSVSDLLEMLNSNINLFKSIDRIEKTTLVLALLRLFRRCSDFSLQKLPYISIKLSQIDFSLGVLMNAFLAIGSVRGK